MSNRTIRAWGTNRREPPQKAPVDPGDVEGASLLTHITCAVSALAATQRWLESSIRKAFGEGQMDVARRLQDARTELHNAGVEIGAAQDQVAGVRRP